MGDMSREPSMEDILSSIRRVIARDEAPGASTRRADQSAEAVPDVLELEDEEEAAAPADGDAPPAAQATADPETLVSPASADAARQSLEALSSVVAPPPAAAAPPAGNPGGRTVEEVALEALRPMLRQWLDTNLPGIVEAMVAREISRITGKRF